MVTKIDIGYVESNESDESPVGRVGRRYRLGAP
jgi:hypothetical protein